MLNQIRIDYCVKTMYLLEWAPTMTASVLIQIVVNAIVQMKILVVI